MMFRSLAIAIALLAPLPAMAGGIEDPTALDTLVAQFTGAAIGEPGGAARPVDSRLKLLRCPDRPVASWFGSSQRSVRVDCPVPGGWTVYVPLVQSARAQPVVARGDQVSVQVSGRGFTVSGRGEALAAGAVGDVISVRTPSRDGKRQTVSGRVLGPGRIGISLP